MQRSPWRRLRKRIASWSPAHTLARSSCRSTDFVHSPNRQGASAVSNGVAKEGSPRREPWGKMCHQQKPRQGDRIGAKENFLSPLGDSDCQNRNPRLTPWATFNRCSAAMCRRFEEFSFLAAEVVVNKGN